MLKTKQFSKINIQRLFDNFGKIQFLLQVKHFVKEFSKIKDFMKTRISENGGFKNPCFCRKSSVFCKSYQKHLTQAGFPGTLVNIFMNKF